MESTLSVCSVGKFSIFCKWFSISFPNSLLSFSFLMMYPCKFPEKLYDAAAFVFGAWR